MFSRGNFTGPILSHLPPPPTFFLDTQNFSSWYILKMFGGGKLHLCDFATAQMPKFSTISENLSLNEKIKYKMLNYFSLN